MPTVPIARREVLPAELPGARITAQPTAEAFGASQGRGLMKVGEAVSRVIERERLAADQIAVLEAERQLGETENALLYDPERGVLNRKGRNAFGAPEETLTAFDERIREIENGLTNDRQRLAFRRSAVRRRLDLDRTVQRHVAAEIQRYDLEQTNAFVSTETSAAIAAAGDAERVGLGIARTRAALADFANRHGLPREWVEQRAGEAVGRIHTGVIERLLAQGADRAAEQYFKATRAEIPGTELARIEKALEEGSLRGESQRRADAIVAKHDDLGGAIEAAKRITDPKLRDAVEQRVRDHFRIKDEIERDLRERTFRTAANALEASRGDLSVIAPGDWVRLDVEQRRALETRSRQLREGVEPVTNWDRYYALLSLAAEPATLRQFTSIDLMRYRHELADTEFKELVAKQAALRQGKNVDEALDGYRTTKQIVDDALAAIGIDPTPKQGTKHAERVNAFRRAVDERILDLQDRTGKKATTQDVQAIVDTLIVRGRIPGSGILWDTRKRLFELEPGEAFDVEVDEIPPAERRKIEEALRRHNRPVTPEAIVELFKLKHLPRQETP